MQDARSVMHFNGGGKHNRSNLGANDCTVQIASCKNLTVTFDFFKFLALLHVCVVCRFAINGLTDR